MTSQTERAAAMARLQATLRNDLRLTQRYGIVYAAVFVTLLWIAVLRALPAAALPLGVPFVIFFDLATFGFYFMAGLILFERAERVLGALIVTPQHVGEYLASKLTALTLAALAISLIVTLATIGLAVNLPLLLLGTLLMSLAALAIAVIAIAPYDGISTFLLPSQLYFLIMALPLVWHFDLWVSPLLYLLPTHGSIVVLRAAFVGGPPGEIVVAALVQVVWLAALIWYAHRRFEQHVLRRLG